MKENDDIEIEMQIKNENVINIFFCTEEIKDFNDLKKEIRQEFNNTIEIIGEFNSLEIVEQLCYYLEIEEKDSIVKNIRNIIISYLSLEQSEKLLQLLIDKFNNEIKNDSHPFLIFLSRKEANFNKKILIEKINTYQNQKNVENNMKYDSKNIFFENQKFKVIDILKRLDNYFNEKDEDEIQVNYKKNETINFLVAGKRGSGKSSFINRILGEKRALSNILYKTSKVNEYYHKEYPLKLIDTAGFQIGSEEESLTIDNFLRINNLEHKNISKRIHYIFYIFKSSDSTGNKFEDKEYDIIKALYSFKVNIYFIITFTKNNQEKSNKKNFKNSLIKCIKSKENWKKELSKFIELMEVKNDGKDLKQSKKDDLEKTFKEKIDNFIFCIDSLENNLVLDDNNKKNGLHGLFASIKSSIEDNTNTCDKILELIKSYENGNSNQEEDNLLLNFRKEGILTKKPIISTENVISAIQDSIKNSIFFTDIKTHINKLKEDALKKIEEFKNKTYFSNPFIFNPKNFNKKLEDLIIEITKIYDVVDQKRQRSQENKEFNYSQLTHKLKYSIKGLTHAVFVSGLSLTMIFPLLGIPLFAIGGITEIASPFFWGKFDKKEIVKILEDIIEEYDNEYNKITKVDAYKLIADNLKKELKDIEKFIELLEKIKYWYDYDIIYD